MVSRFSVFLIVLMLIVVSVSVSVFAERLPVVTGDSDNWGTILNGYLRKLGGNNATYLNISDANGLGLFANGSRVGINTTVPQQELNVVGHSNIHPSITLNYPKSSK